MKPLRIKIIKRKNLFIKWDDQTESEIALDKLRMFCPCATCLAARDKQGKSYIPLWNNNQVEILNINQVGSYAISIFWKDGHNTGIYEYTFLKKLAVMPGETLVKTVEK
jgi:DUF971 family protein